MIHPLDISWTAMAAMLAQSLANGFAAYVGSAAIAALWQGVALISMTALCLRFGPQTGASQRFVLWTAVLMLVCLLPLVATTPAAGRSSVLHLDPRWSVALAALWLALSVLRALDLARHALRLRSLASHATAVTLQSEVASRLQAHHRVQLCTSNQLDRPGVIGFFQPRILIPEWLFAQLTAPELEQIVLHELEHLRRRDDWLNLFQKLLLVAFPLNPALYWIERRLCLERELACDEGVVSRTRAPRLYAACLARLAEHRLDHRVLSLALGLLERQSELARRVSGILRSPRTFSPGQSFAVTGTLAMVLLGGSAELARCPQLVSFGAAPLALASYSGTPGLASEAWVPLRGNGSLIYNEAAAPHILHTAWSQTRRRSHKAKNRRRHVLLPQQRAAAQKTLPNPSVDTASLSQQAPAPAMVAPTLVRYTLVRVDGGWLLLQL